MTDTNRPENGVKINTIARPKCVFFEELADEFFVSSEAFPEPLLTRNTNPSRHDGRLRATRGRKGLKLRRERVDKWT